MTQEKLAQPSMYCRQCGYALIGLSEDRCPECGRPFDPADPRTFCRYPRGYEFRRSIKKDIRVVAFVVLLWASIAVSSSGWLYWRYHAGWQAEQPAIAALKASAGDVFLWTTLSGHGGPRPLYRIIVPLDYLRARVRSIGATGPARWPVNLADLGALKGCTGIGLTNLGITDDQLKHLEGMTQLTSLYLNRNPGITDAGLQHLTGLAILNTLCLDDTAVTDAGLKRLEGLTKLQDLSLYRTKVTEEGIGQIRKALPSLDVNGP